MPIQHVSPNSPNAHELLGFRELFSKTWDQYKKRAIPLLAVILISAVILGTLAMIMVLCGMFGGAILTHFMDQMTGLYIIGGLLSILSLFFVIMLIWCQGTMLAMAVDEELGIIEAFQRGWEYLWPLTWVVTILSAIALAGFIFGFFPGFLFLTWFIFSVYILFEEDRRGMQSLLASREYVRGYGLDIFGKIMVVWLLSAMAGLIPFLGQIFSILFTPFFLLYLLNIYRDLKSIKGTIQLGNTTATPIFWWAVTIIGLIVPVAGFAWLIFSLFAGNQPVMPPPWEGGHGVTM